MENNIADEKSIKIPSSKKMLDWFLLVVSVIFIFKETSGNNSIFILIGSILLSYSIWRLVSYNEIFFIKHSIKINSVFLGIVVSTKEIQNSNLNSFKKEYYNSSIKWGMGASSNIPTMRESDCVRIMYTDENGEKKTLISDIKEENADLILLYAKRKSK